MRSKLPAARFISLQARLLLGTVVVLLLVMATVIVVVEHRQRAAIIGEVQRRGEVIARHLAAISTGPLLLYNFIAIEQNVARVSGEPDVAYAVILDSEGKVATHSRHPELVGRTLTGSADEQAAAANTLLVQELVLPETGELIYDFAVPVTVGGQRWGTVRVGLSKQRMEAEIRRTRWELGGLTLVTMVLGGFTAALVARRIARPVRRLAGGAAAIARGMGAKRAITLQVSAPSHSPLMAPAADRLKAELEKLAFNSLKIPLVTNAGAEPVIGAAEVKDSLVRQLTSPVRWVDVVRRMRRDGVGLIVEIGPGKALAGLVKRIEKDMNILNLCEPSDIEAAASALNRPYKPKNHEEAPCR